jgi:hypothetical protein
MVLDVVDSGWYTTWPALATYWNGVDWLYRHNFERESLILRDSGNPKRQEDSGTRNQKFRFHAHFSELAQ